MPLRSILVVFVSVNIGVDGVREQDKCIEKARNPKHGSSSSAPLVPDAEQKTFEPSHYQQDPGLDEKSSDPHMTLGNDDDTTRLVVKKNELQEIDLKGADLVETYQDGPEEEERSWHFEPMNEGWKRGRKGKGKAKGVELMETYQDVSAAWPPSPTKYDPSYKLPEGVLIHCHPPDSMCWPSDHFPLTPGQKTGQTNGFQRMFPQQICPPMDKYVFFKMGYEKDAARMASIYEHNAASEHSPEMYYGTKKSNSKGYNPGKHQMFGIRVFKGQNLSNTNGWKLSGCCVKWPGDVKGNWIPADSATPPVTRKSVSKDVYHIPPLRISPCLNSQPSQPLKYTQTSYCYPIKYMPSEFNLFRYGGRRKWFPENVCGVQYSRDERLVFMKKTKQGFKAVGQTGTTSKALENGLFSEDQSVQFQGECVWDIEKSRYNNRGFKVVECDTPAKKATHKMMTALEFWEWRARLKQEKMALMRRGSAEPRYSQQLHAEVQAVQNNLKANPQQKLKHLQCVNSIVHNDMCTCVGDDLMLKIDVKIKDSDLPEDGTISSLPPLRLDLGCLDKSLTDVKTILASSQPLKQYFGDNGLNFFPLLQMQYTFEEFQHAFDDPDDLGVNPLVTYIVARSDLSSMRDLKAQGELKRELDEYDLIATKVNKDPNGQPIMQLTVKLGSGGSFTTAGHPCSPGQIVLNELCSCVENDEGGSDLLLRYRVTMNFHFNDTRRQRHVLLQSQILQGRCDKTLEDIKKDILEPSEDADDSMKINWPEGLKKKILYEKQWQYQYGFTELPGFKPTSAESRDRSNEVVMANLKSNEVAVARMENGAELRSLRVPCIKYPTARATGSETYDYIGDLPKDGDGPYLQLTLDLKEDGSF
eukprot:gnl/MRDRNA2_/MRDRNA2_34626_c0_seq1.p1 gnl/MRDRNA2_/MRDRNA2_34626_c0~~gnl/MRDRNA2_/MRDRNA2_34626_c0_seq1.p1  ORF type:complete len:869 (+),score=114.52 gnl/MRDRNA2_/MRDRNA2_34626_c0_seq1:190-2796(+)